MDSDDDKIVEDVPRMRSVSMMASPSAMIREAPHLVKEYGSVPQSPFAPKAAPLVKTAPVVLPSLPSSWTNPTLETIPLYYRLERTHATVRAEPAVVAQRLSDCFRGQSMGTVYHDNEVGDCIRRFERTSCLGRETMVARVVVLEQKASHD